MAKADLEELYPLVAEGDTVELIGQRNEETAQLFGNGENPAAPVQPTLLATSPMQAQVPDGSSAAALNSPAPAVAALVASR
jgi:hypothetical protein